MNNKEQRYQETLRRIDALCEGETDRISIMATISCELFHTFGHFDWVGFYRNVGNDTLKVGPYQGGHGCLVIPFSKGVCGAAARTREIQNIADVNAIEDHIACSTTTQSELVLPVIVDNELIAVFDIDSDQLGAFDQIDIDYVGKILKNIH